MTLTPEDVSNKRFTPVRLREGYDMGEVDQFLDEVEAELARLLAENDDLRSKLTAGGIAVEPKAPAKAGPEASDKSGQKDGQKDGAKDAQKDAQKDGQKDGAKDAQASETVVAAAAPREEIRVVTAAEASSAATRLLELATNNADAVVAEAKDEAEQIVVAARAEAERLETETKDRTDKLEQEARSRAQNLDSEIEAKRAERLDDVEKAKVRLDAEVENLRAFEREYRSRLKSYFTQQLQALDGTGEGGELPDAGDGAAPKRLKTVPGDDAPAGEAGSQDGRPSQA